MAETTTQAPTKRDIFKMVEFADSDGRHITVRQAMDGSEVYLGHAKGAIPINPKQATEITYSFEIEADSVVEAFERMDATCKVAWPGIQEQHIAAMREQARPKVVVAGGPMPAAIPGGPH